MGNRHHHKKLRVEVRARMARTGESYQRALARILEERTARGRDSVDLVGITHFGIPAAAATFEIAGRLACTVVSRHHLAGPSPRSPLFALTTPQPRAVH